ncbi:137_t:CDS:1, partial [Funneliformis caledonium]
MVCKKNKRHIQSIPSVTLALTNETQTKSLTITDMELQELICQSLVVEVHEVLEYDRK